MLIGFGERSFGSINRWFSAGTKRYVGAVKTHTQHLLKAIAHNLYTASGIVLGNAAKLRHIYKTDTVLRDE